MKKYIIIIMLVLVTFFFVACEKSLTVDDGDAGDGGDGGDGGITGFTVVYDGNNNTSGNVPIDNNFYEWFDDVIVLNNTGDLEKTGNTFSGWNTTSDGTGTHYDATGTDSFSMPEENVILYAQWEDISGITRRDMVSVTGTMDDSYTQEDTEGNSFVHNISSFDIGMYEITYDLWYTVYQWAINNNYIFENAGQEGNAGTEGEAPTPNTYKPVTNIGWNDAVVWCNAYSEISGKTPVYFKSTGELLTDSTFTSYTISPYPDWTADGYRLPTEGEWQYARVI